MASSGSALSEGSLLTRLPETIRRIIYFFIGLDRGVIAPLHGYPSGCTCFFCRRGPVEHQIFLVSRAVSKHAREFFYSMNMFFFSDQYELGVPSLKNLTPIALSSLHRVLGVFQYNFWLSYDRDDNETAEKCIERDRHLFHRYPRLVADWRRFCRRLAMYTQPNRLELNILASVGSLRAAGVIFKPLLQLPRVQTCTIGTTGTNDRQMQSFLEEVVHRLTSPSAISVSTVPFPFNDLPVEIQLLVLEHTGIVNPFYRLEWYEGKSAFFDAECVNEICRCPPGGLHCELYYVGFSSPAGC